MIDPNTILKFVGKEVLIVITKTGARYTGTLSHYSPKRQVLTLKHLGIYGRNGNCRAVPKHGEARSFRVEKLEMIREAHPEVDYT